MKNVYIKNIPHEKVLALAGQVRTLPGQVVSKTLSQTSALSLTLFAFAKGGAIGPYDSRGDTLANVIEGVGRFTVDGVDYRVSAGEVLVMPAQKPHTVFAEEDFKMMLTVVFSA
ncbi:MAG: cupin domain-containing protein [Eubacteriales bacterium]|nr:cupin domain-containing protein [Eubacteriales bacterium]